MTFRTQFSIVFALAASAMFTVAQAAIPTAERNALLALNASTNGASWGDSTGWNGPVGTECSWFGVTCDVGSSHVTGINLPNQNLTGVLSSLSSFTNLDVFVVYLNQLSGPIPALTGLTNLGAFDVDSNQLTGSIPVLTGLTNLGYFYAYNNQLTGSIPDLTGLSNLAAFDVNSNQMTGSIPDLTGLSNLRFLAVYSNQLTGPIPDLSGLTSLQNFLVGANHLSGALPAPPSGLLAAQSTLSPNDFPASSYVNNLTWDAATGVTPWYTPCDSIFANGFEGP